jgi:DEAD/DEAH box helicase domain-containing protein
VRLKPKVNAVFFDLETQRTFDEVGGRHNIRKLGLAVAVTYSASDGAFHHFAEAQVDRLVDHLKAADLVVGFNVLSFDYEVLRKYRDDVPDPRKTVDMLDHIYRRLGFRVSLDNLASATLGTRKSADGLQAVRWYKEGRIQEVFDYCQQDVEVTRQLYEYGRTFKHVKYTDGRYRTQMVAVVW